jgi:hypothetical protein
VVEVEVRDEDGADIGQPDRPQQLLLGPLAAVEEDALATGTQQQRREAPARGRDGPGGAGEEERHVHGR